MRSYQEIVDDLKFQIKWIESLASIRSAQVRIAADQQAIVDKSMEMIPVIELSKEMYQRAVDLVYEESVGKLTNLLNAALTYVFWDKNYKAVVDVSDYRGKSIALLLENREYNPPLVVDTRDGVGNGVRTVVSFVIQVYYILSRRAAPVLFLDEAYSAISESYVDRFFEFVKKLAKSRGIHLVMISHDDRIIIHADRQYRVSDGVISVIEDRKVESVPEAKDQVEDGKN